MTYFVSSLRSLRAGRCCRTATLFPNFDASTPVKSYDVTTCALHNLIQRLGGLLRTSDSGSRSHGSQSLQSLKSFTSFSLRDACCVSNMPTFHRSGDPALLRRTKMRKAKTQKIRDPPESVSTSNIRLAGLMTPVRTVFTNAG